MWDAKSTVSCFWKGCCPQGLNTWGFYSLAPYWCSLRIVSTRRTCTVCHSLGTLFSEKVSFLFSNPRDRRSLFSNQFMRNRILVAHFWEPLPVLSFSSFQALTWNLSWGINNVEVFVPLWSLIIFRRFVYRNRIRDLCDHWKWCR